MLAVLAAFAAVWLAVWRLGLTPERRLAVIGGLWVLLVGLLLIRPGLAQHLGEARLWLVLGGAVGLVIAYRAGLARLRAMAPAPVAVAAAQAGPFTAAELERYARHILLREIGGQGQRRLKEARVAIIGAGGLGSPVALYLAGAGVGQITLIDGDRVDRSNLQRQIIHREAGIGQAKVQSAAEQIRALNPGIAISAHQIRLSESSADLLDSHDLILDGSDNFATRYLVNAAATRHGIALISGAMTQWEGQVSLFSPAQGTPCYACVFPQAPAPGLVPSCAEAGVMAALPGVIGAIMASEAIKHLTGAGQTLAGRLLIWDALSADMRIIGLARRPGCPVCGAGHA